MSVRVVVIGADDLQRQLDLLVRNATSGEANRALLAGGFVIRDGIRDKIVERGLVDSAVMWESVDAQVVKPLTVEVSEGPLPYVFAHEFGLENQIITQRQRRFFWAKYRETGASMWRALALSVTYTIPARPHFRPGVRQSTRRAIAAVARKLRELVIGR